MSPSNAALTDDMGKLSITDDHAIYTGSSHWVTILEDVGPFYELTLSSTSVDLTTNAKC